jgi:hypothetical protein
LVKMIPSSACPSRRQGAMFRYALFANERMIWVNP